MYKSEKALKGERQLPDAGSSVRAVGVGAARYIDKAVRIMTLAPLMALLLVGILFAANPEQIGGVVQLISAVVFLCVFPILAYPLQRFIPYYKHKGREGQRNLAIIFANAGYVFCLIFALALSAPSVMKELALTYLVSGLLIVLFNKGFKLRASGHACGVAGPIAFLCYRFGGIALLGLILFAAMTVSSVRMKRHTLWQVLLGAAISVCATVISVLII